MNIRVLLRMQLISKLVRDEPWELAVSRRRNTQGLPTLSVCHTLFPVLECYALSCEQNSISRCFTSNESSGVYAVAFIGKVSPSR